MLTEARKPLLENRLDAPGNRTLPVHFVLHLKEVRRVEGSTLGEISEDLLDEVGISLAALEHHRSEFATGFRAAKIPEEVSDIALVEANDGNADQDTVVVELDDSTREGLIGAEFIFSASDDEKDPRAGVP